MVSPRITLVAADIGNIQLKYRLPDGQAVVEPSLVRLAPTTLGYSFTNDTPIRPLTYISGPANLASTPYLIGQDAERGGTGDVAVIGSAHMRLASAAYVLLHLYTILASLPPDYADESIIFAGGLPIEDTTHPHITETLRQHIKGTHLVTWGDTTYTLTITGVMLVPQPIGGIATLLLDPDGHIPSQDALHHQWFALDIGGGTTDYTGRTGLNVIPGTEGGVRLGIQNAAQLARQLIQHRYPALQHLDTGQVLAQMRQSDPVIYLSGEPLSIQTEIDAAVTQTSHEILAHILPQWERHLAQGEVVLFGGGGAQMAAPIQQVLQDFTRVTLLSDPLFRVLDGIERLARRQLSQKNSSG